MPGHLGLLGKIAPRRFSGGIALKLCESAQPGGGRRNELS